MELKMKINISTSTPNSSEVSPLLGAFLALNLLSANIKKSKI